MPKRYRFPGHVAIPTSHSRRGLGRGPRTRSIPVRLLHVEFKSSFPEAKRKCPAWQRTKSPSFCPVVSFFSPPSCKATPKEAHCSLAVSPSTPSCTSSTRPAGRRIWSDPGHDGRADMSGRGTRNRLASDFSTWFKFPSTTTVAFFRFLFPRRLSRDVLNQTNLGTKTSEPELKKPMYV